MNLKRPIRVAYVKLPPQYEDWGRVELHRESGGWVWKNKHGDDLQMGTFATVRSAENGAIHRWRAPRYRLKATWC